MRPGPIAAAVVLGAVFLIWVVWAALGASAPRAAGQVAGFQVRGMHRLDVAVVLSGVRGKVVCSVQALDADRIVVGVTDATVTLSEDSSEVRTEVVVRTRATAVSAVVRGCSGPSD